MQKNELEGLCKLIRYSILTSTTEAGSGHPTSSFSAVELMATLMFGGFFQQDIDNPKRFDNDRLIFSKGHAAPLLYSLYHAAGVVTDKELLTLRKFGSALEGHPVPKFKFVDVSTGSLGQGLSVGVGMALGIRLRKTIDAGNLKLDKEVGGLKLENQPSSIKSQNPDSSLKHLLSIPKVWVLLGDSEMAEGQVWEAMEIASYYKLNNLIGILDVNRLGQRGETMLGWDTETYEKRIKSFGWNTIVIKKGHDLKEVYDAFDKAQKQLSSLSLKPTMIIAKTVKGKGLSLFEDKNGWHGKPLDKEQLKMALKELGPVDSKNRGKIEKPLTNKVEESGNTTLKNEIPMRMDLFTKPISTREAYGDALMILGKINKNIVALDAEVSNSTYSEKFKKAFPERFFEMFIAEQNMVSASLGISKLGMIPFASSFSAFLTRSFDQLRIAQYSQPNLKIVGSHAGVSIGEDGPSQMGLEDLAMMRSLLGSVVFYSSDGVSTFKLTELMANNNGLFYMRTTREKTPIIYDKNEKFEIGGLKIHKPNKIFKTTDLKVLIIAAGITLHEALKAQKVLAEENIEAAVVDLYCVKPLDEKTIRSLANKYKNVIVVEDHFQEGGIGEAVSGLIQVNIHLCVRKMPGSGKAEELRKIMEIDSSAIVKSAKKILK